MTTTLRLSILVLLASTALACGSEAAGPSASISTGGTGSSDPIDNPMQMAPVDDTFVPTGAQAEMYMGYIGPALLGRTLTDAEHAKLNAEAGSAVKPMLESWFIEPGFAEAVRGLMETRLHASGKLGDVDYNLAGYLVRHIVAHKLPWSQVVTSTTYYDENDIPLAGNDTGAPYSAGVLTTRGYLAGNEGRFNLSRAHTMLKTFMCRDYPHETELQPPVDALKLKLMFRAKSAEDQKVAEAAGGFGNGLACYSCHSQFSLHAQPFVKFDKSGVWRADATGLQSAVAQLGDGDNGTAASHWDSPDVAGLEESSWFGTAVANLADAGAAIGQHDKFRECTLQQVLDLAIGLNPAYETGVKGLKVDPAFLTEIAESVSARNADPPIQDLAAAVLADPRVIATAINGMRR